MMTYSAAVGAIDGGGCAEHSAALTVLVLVMMDVVTVASVIMITIMVIRISTANEVCSGRSMPWASTGAARAVWPA